MDLFPMMRALCFLNFLPSKGLLWWSPIMSSVGHHSTVRHQCCPWQTSPHGDAPSCLTWIVLVILQLSWHSMTFMLSSQIVVSLQHSHFSKKWFFMTRMVLNHQSLVTILAVVELTVCSLCLFEIVLASPVPKIWMFSVWLFMSAWTAKAASGQCFVIKTSLLHSAFQMFQHS